MQTFYKIEDDSDDSGPLRSIGDGFFVVRLSVDYWKEGGYVSVVVLRQTCLDLIWYKISINEKLKTANGDLSDTTAKNLIDSKTLGILIKTKRTQWIFDLYNLEYDLAHFISEDLELHDLKEMFGEESADMIFKIKNNPEMKKLVKFK